MANKRAETLPRQVTLGPSGGAVMWQLDLGMEIQLTVSRMSAEDSKSGRKKGLNPQQQSLGLISGH